MTSAARSRAHQAISGGRRHTDPVLPEPLQKVLAPAARWALPRLRESLGAGTHDLAQDAALGKAAGEVAAQLLQQGTGSITDDRVEHLSRVMLETLGRTDEVSLQPDTPVSGYRTSLIDSFRQALHPLDDEGVGFREIGIDTTADEVAVAFVDALTESLHLWGAKSERLRSAAELLHIEKLRELQPPAQAGGPSPPLVRAWITVETTPPELYVFNDGPSPIYNVVPTPLLVASDWSGEDRAMIGGGAFYNSAAAQISPEYGHRWPLDHMNSWGGQPRVRSLLRVDLTDNAGSRWRLERDQLTPLEELHV